MYNKLSLKNFRGFKDFSMELKPVTLIAGKNNTGKTSVLESVFLFQKYSDVNVFLILQNLREPTIDFRHTPALTANNVWNPFFYGMNPEETLEIKLDDEFTLRLKKDTEYALPENIPNALKSRVDFSITKNYTLRCDFSKEPNNFSGAYVIGGNDNMNFSTLIPSNTDIPVPVNPEYIQFLGPSNTLSDEQVAENFGILDLNNNKQELIDILKILEKDISDITTVAIDRRVQLYISKQNSRLPVGVMGDGIRKILHIALTLLVNPGCILLMDEVENGLHYSLFPKFWEIVAKLAVEGGCQVIATTHSYECVQGATEGVHEGNLQDYFSFTRLDREEGTIKPKRYTIGSLERSINTGWEVR
ncbi:MAG: AAA family ATPase [Turicibacter sp.]|nr:AAA family ATPase [Turicibacter sp.]